jgi:hypothetical protein
MTVHVDKPDSIRAYLEKTTWGTITIGDNAPTHQLICPLCMAVIPAVFTNANQLPGDMTPKRVHTDYHAAIATALRNVQSA